MFVRIVLLSIASLQIVGKEEMKVSIILMRNGARYPMSSTQDSNPQIM